jgi:toxin ParE1/3/4
VGTGFSQKRCDNKQIEQDAASELAHLALAMQMLASTPFAGHKREDLTDEPVRFWSVFSYLIVYDPQSKPLGVARILHGRQDVERILPKTPPRFKGP